eukprot:COSAG06_NODE_749_length_12615_cov_35.521333_9_plen_100_part_00
MGMRGWVGWPRVRVGWGGRGATDPVGSSEPNSVRPMVSRSDTENTPLGSRRTALAGTARPALMVALAFAPCFHGLTTIGTPAAPRHAAASPTSAGYTPS